jgi:hypothetical protein
MCSSDTNITPLTPISLRNRKNIERAINLLKGTATAGMTNGPEALLLAAKSLSIRESPSWAYWPKQNLGEISRIYTQAMEEQFE